MVVRAEVNVSETDLAWLAGLLEGEGCFYEVPSQRHYPGIAVVMTDKDVLERVAALMDAKIYTKIAKQREHHKQAWRVQVSGIKAVEWMKVLRPLMGERRQAKIDQVLAAGWTPPPPRTKKIPQVPLDLVKQMIAENL